MPFMRRGIDNPPGDRRREPQPRCSAPAPPRPPCRKAELTPGGRAIAPPSAPPSVKAMIDAANHIRHRPYVWGGGHRNWNSRGYDCSGSVSYVLHAGGLLEYSLDSTGFMRWGGGGPGCWVRIYANRDQPTRSSPACAGTPR